PVPVRQKCGSELLGLQEMGRSTESFQNLLALGVFLQIHRQPFMPALSVPMIKRVGVRWHRKDAAGVSFPFEEGNAFAKLFAINEAKCEGTDADANKLARDETACVDRRGFDNLVPITPSVVLFFPVSRHDCASCVARKGRSRSEIVAC